MKAIIDLSEVEDQLANCKPGDEYSIVFTVDSKTDEELTGTASDVEHLGAEGEGEYEEGAAPEEEMPKGPAKKKMPKAIVMISR